MKIGLADIDSHNFPNLPLMKLSAYHKSLGHEVDFWHPVEKYDVLYKSKVFSFTNDVDYAPMADMVIEGGTGYDNSLVLPNEIESIMPDYELYPRYNEAYGFLTRGCPRNCGFCIVTKKEGYLSTQVANLRDFWTNQKIIKLLDPNLLACTDREQILQELALSGAWIDFTQGLDIRLVNEDIIKLLNNVKIKIIHFAWDNPNEDLTELFKLFTRHTNINHYTRRGVYILTNYNSSHREDLERVYTLRDLGFNPYIMVYDKQNAPHLTRQLQRWVNNRRIFRSATKFEEYDYKR